jgi:hypothetical protein
MSWLNCLSGTPDPRTVPSDPLGIHRGGKNLFGQWNGSGAMLCSTHDLKAVASTSSHGLSSTCTFVASMAHTGQTIVFGDMILAFDSLAALYRFGPRLIIANAIDAPAGGARLATSRRKIDASSIVVNCARRRKDPPG